MSLNVYIEDSELSKHKCICSSCDNEHENIFHKNLYESNITHNLGAMADACGLYGYLWRHEENNISYAYQLINPLTSGLELLISDPIKFKQFNSENGWGVYENFVEFVQSYLEACKKFPNGKIEVWR